jgi:hypothetical protein
MAPPTMVLQKLTTMSRARAVLMPKLLTAACVQRSTTLRFRRPQLLSSLLIQAEHGQTSPAAVFDGSSSNSRARRSTITIPLLVAALAVPAFAAVSNTHCQPKGTDEPYPKILIADLYPALKGQKISAPTTEGGFQGVWPYWVAFCKKEKKTPPRHPPSTSLGLNLYLPETFTGNSGHMSYHNYNKFLVSGFFNYLKEEKCTSGVLVKAKTFLKTGELMNLWKATMDSCWK